MNYQDLHGRIVKKGMYLVLEIQTSEALQAFSGPSSGVTGVFWDEPIE